ncbi:MAG: alanine/ornithine racemase family PLP-dependent enzyme [Bacteroidales bacterium]|jgi:predicted amino acid racemase|nr:alanine/ornithine racemase family PLP-dependent enzyme [Bacteroidales bacterium]
MAFIVLNKEKLAHNFTFLNKLFKKHKIEWAVVSKLLCGNKAYIKEVIDLGIKQICDSRVSNLKAIKEIDSNIETIYIKPPAKRSLKSIIKYADISINTEFTTIKLLNLEARKLNKTHKIMIMIEMGELREGVMWDDFIDFYESVFELSNIEVVGIGTNLSCLYGVLPNQDKLIQLSLYEQLIEAKFNKNIAYVSGGSSVTIPLIFQGLLPQSINHFRVGETLFLGTDVYNDSTIRNMEHNVFQLFAEIIELSEKPMIPSGEMGTNVEGNGYDFDDNDVGKSSYRAILDIGLLDVEEKHIQPKDNNIEIAGSSSDMIVLDIGKNPKNYKVGDLIEFSLDYMGTLSVLNSRYIEKRIK